MEQAFRSGVRVSLAANSAVAWSSRSPIFLLLTLCYHREAIFKGTPFMRAWIIILRFTGMLLFLIALVGGFIRVIVLPNLSGWLDAFDYLLPIEGGMHP